jgi:hypothetical protein
MKDGLSRTERRLLQLAERGPIVMNAVFPRMHDGEEAYYVTDLSLAEMVDLARTSPALIAFAATERRKLLERGSDSHEAAGGTAGSRDRVACGLDKWLGGVHLGRLEHLAVGRRVQPGDGG